MCHILMFPLCLEGAADVISSEPPLKDSQGTSQTFLIIDDGVI